MKNLKYALLTGLVLFASTAFAIGPSVLIGGGPSDGEYRTFAASTCKNLGALFDCHAIETKGTGDNVDRLDLPLSDPKAVHVAFVKGTVAEEMQKDPTFDEKYVFVRPIAGEAIIVVATKEVADAVKNWQGVRDSAFLLSVALPGTKSGDAAVYNALAGVPNSPLKDMEVIQVESKLAVVQAVKNGTAKIGWLVQYANPDNKLFKAIDEAGLVVMGVVDPDLIQVSTVFQVQVVPVTNANLMKFKGSKQIETTTASAAIVARNPKVMEDARASKVQAAVIRRVKEASEASLLPDAPWVQGLINAATVKSGAGLESLVGKMQTAAAGAKERLTALGTTH